MRGLTLLKNSCSLESLMLTVPLVREWAGRLETLFMERVIRFGNEANYLNYVCDRACERAILVLLWFKRPERELAESIMCILVPSKDRFFS